MPFRCHAKWTTANPDMVRECDTYVTKFPSVYGDGRSRVRVDNGPVDLSQEYEGNDDYNLTPVDAWDLYDYSDEFHQFEYTTQPKRYFARR
jgi:hypothetical protein